MLQTSRILVRAFSHAALAVIVGTVVLSLHGCGQTGSLYLPTEPAAAQRATLPQSLWPVMPEKKAVPAPPAPPPAVPQPVTVPPTAPAS